MLSQLLIVDAESYDPQTMSANPIGTGPYTVTEYVVNSILSVTARDDYWGEKPAIKNVNFKCMSESSQVVNALETGDVEVAQVAAADAEYVGSLGPYDVNEANPGMGVAAFYNMSPDAPLGTKEARYAIDYAIDRQSIVDVAFAGHATITNWPLSGALVDFEERFDNLHETYSVGYDIAKAKEMAEKAGLVGKDIRIITNGAADYITVAEIMQASLLEIGVNAEILNYDQATYYSMLMDVSTYDIALYMTSAPSVMASDIFANYPTFITQGWEGPEREEFLKISRETLSTFDKQEYSDKLLKVTEMFEDFSPWYGVCDILALWTFNKDIQGVEFSLVGDVRFQKMSFAS
jgi:peptide/nickel transport system substrate-binding protein